MKNVRFTQVSMKAVTPTPAVDFVKSVDLGGFDANEGMSDKLMNT